MKDKDIRKEAWKDIKNYEGYYQVSDLGTVRSLDRTVNGNSLIGRTLKPYISKQGYLRVNLSKNGKSRKFFNHRLVLLSFIGRIAGRDQVNHINGIKVDNSLDNLEWVSCSENIRHALLNKLKVPLKGVCVGNNKYSEELVLSIKSFIKNGYRNYEISNMLGVPRQLVSDIKCKKSWGHLDE